MKRNLAIVANSNNVYSETFIQAHKNIDANIFFYYSGGIPQKLENQGDLYKSSMFLLKIYFKLFTKGSVDEFLFKRSLKTNKIDAVLVEYGTNAVHVVDICKKIKIPMFTYFFGYDAYIDEVLKANVEKYKKVFSYCKNIFAVSLDMKNQLIKLGCAAEKIIYSPCAPSDIFYDVAPRFTQTKSFFAMGRFVNKKAPESTILAFKKVVDKYPESKLYFGGTGELKEVVERLTKYFGLEKNVEFVGVLRQQDYIRYYDEVLAFVQHSITAANGDKEGTPVAVLEASLAGVPVIATKHAGIPEVIPNEETGILVEEHDIDAMAGAMIRLIENPLLAKQMGTKGKSYIKDNFSMAKHLKTIESTIFS